MDERFKALQSGPSPLAWAWVRSPLLTMYFFQSFFEVKNYMQGKVTLRVRMAEWSKALCSGRSPLLWAWSFFEVKNYMQGKAILRVRMAERSKALRSGRSPLLWAWSFLSFKKYARESYSACQDGRVRLRRSFRSQSTSVGVGWPSGQRRCVHVEVGFGVVAPTSGWPSGLKRCNLWVVRQVHLRVRGLKKSHVDI
ncbi:hypothetical protein TNCV_228751 [Trichonephila clavipes]|nr:hypothetical protein TNCV_228751 [Trichonephila clavipes]